MNKIPLVGHLKQRETFRRLADRSRLPSSMSFSGPAGVGKRRVAHELIETLLCKARDPARLGGCTTCQNCRLFASNSHPDIREINCLERDENSVEHMREAIASLHLHSSMGGIRAVIFDCFEALSVQAQNTLLKTFEEPPPETYLILLTSAPSRILPTILSRCQQWFFHSLTPTQLHEILLTQALIPNFQSLDQNQQRDLVTFADGSLATVHMLSSHAEQFKDASHLIDAINEGNAARLHQTVPQLAKSDDLEAWLNFVRVIAHQRMHHARSSSQQFRWATFLANTLQAHRLISERHLSAHAVLSNLLASLLPASQLNLPRTVPTLDQIAL